MTFTIPNSEGATECWVPRIVNLRCAPDMGRTSGALLATAITGSSLAMTKQPSGSPFSTRSWAAANRQHPHPWADLHDILYKRSRNWPHTGLHELLPQAWKVAASTPSCPAHARPDAKPNIFRARCSEVGGCLQTDGSLCFMEADVGGIPDRPGIAKEINAEFRPKRPQIAPAVQAAAVVFRRYLQLEIRSRGPNIWLLEDG